MKRTGLAAFAFLWRGDLVSDVDTPAPVITGSMVLLGTGFGPGNIAFVVAVQAAVPWAVRGVVTSSTQLFRNLGGTVGIALLGALLNERLRAGLPGGVFGAETDALLNPATRGTVSPETMAALRFALSDALHSVFAVLIGLALLALAVMLFYARNNPQQVAGPAVRDAGSDQPATPGGMAGQASC